ncbi:MAG: hypothetical protein HRU15_06400 [Planctomycetes bacterium]|nr:hypothetical protein [Planctomycetota bacterium]
MLSRTLLTCAMLGAGTLACGALMAEEGDIEIHGFASFGFIKTSDHNYHGNSDRGSFEFNEFGINFRAELDDSTSYGLQLFSRDLGELGNNEIVIDWGFVDHQFNDMIGTRIGRVKLPTSMYNEYQDVDAVRNTVFMPQAVYSASFRDATVAVDGATIYGNFATESAGDIDYNLFYGIMNIAENGSVTKAVGVESLDSDMDYAVGGNITYNTPLEGLRVAFGYAYLSDWDMGGDVHTYIPGGTIPTIPVGVNSVTPLDLNTKSYISRTLSVEYTYNDWVFAAEYNTANAIFLDNASGAEVFNVNSSGWYMQADYRLNEKWAFAAYYMEYLSDRDDSAGADSDPAHRGWQDEIVFSSRYDINDNWNLKAEVHFINGTALLNGSDNGASQLVPGSGTWKEDWTMYAIKSSVTF